VRRCTVCQMEFEDGDEVATLPCTHFYHPDCIGQWLRDRKVRFSSCLMLLLGYLSAQRTCAACRVSVHKRLTDVAARAPDINNRRLLRQALGSS